MRILVTAGNSVAPIDQVRCITNIFTGRTGTQIALHAASQGDTVRLLTSHPELVADLCGENDLQKLKLQVHKYRTFTDLEGLLRAYVSYGHVDAVIHCAAVNDYEMAGVFAPASNTHFRHDSIWECDGDGRPTLVDRRSAKVKSDEPELWLRLVRTPKLIDCMRSTWGFRNVLVKFKLEVGVGDDELLKIAERSRTESQADLMVANTLEGAADWAFVGPVSGDYKRVIRCKLPETLLEAIESLIRERQNG